MADEPEPTGWELRRALEAHIKQAADNYRTLLQRIDQLVTRQEFEAERRRVDERNKDLGDDIAQEQRARQDAVSELAARTEAGQTTLRGIVDKLTANLKWVAAAVLLPIGLTIATIYFATR